MTFVILRAWYCKMLMSVGRIVSEVRRGSATAPSITICALDRRFVERDRKTFDMTQSAARRPPHSMSWIEQVTLTCPNITEHKPNLRPAPPVPELCGAGQLPASLLIFAAGPAGAPLSVSPAPQGRPGWCHVCSHQHTQILTVRDWSYTLKTSIINSSSLYFHKKMKRLKNGKLVDIW